MIFYITRNSNLNAFVAYPIVYRPVIQLFRVKSQLVCNMVCKLFGLLSYNWLILQLSHNFRITIFRITIINVCEDGCMGGLFVTPSRKTYWTHFYDTLQYSLHTSQRLYNLDVCADQVVGNCITKE